MSPVAEFVSPSANRGPCGDVHRHGSPMPFQPPRCPYTACSAHFDEVGGDRGACRFIRWGSFRAACRPDPEPRYRCKRCGRTFSRQTFRHDYRDRRPETNKLLFDLLTSGVGLRQSGRVLGLGIGSVQRKFRKLARTCARLHANLSRKLAPGRCYILDEEESYETTSIRPVTVPILIERESWFIVHASAAPIRRLAAPGSRRRLRQEMDEARHGRRPDRSRACVRRTLRQLDRRTDGELTLDTDEKSSYRTLAREVFGDRVRHRRTSSRVARSTSNPLFPINTTIAMSRDNCGRLRRRSWLVSKKRRWLRAQLAIFTVYRNYVRCRFNRDDERVSPASSLGLLTRRITSHEALRWRQDWGARSVHPLSLSGRLQVA